MIPTEELPRAKTSFIPRQYRLDASESERSRWLAAANLERKLNALTAEFRVEGLSSKWLSRIGETFDRINLFGKYSDQEMHQIILWAIEVKALHLVTEIAEELGVGRPWIVALMNDMEKLGLVYKVDRYVPGSDRQYVMYKSSRVENVEASGEIMANIVRGGSYSPSIYS